MTTGKFCHNDGTVWGLLASRKQRLLGPHSEIGRIGTGVALRAVAADEAAADDLLSAGHRELLAALLQDATAANTTRYRSPVQRFKA